MSQFHYVDFAMVLLIANYQLYYMLIANSWTQSGILRSRLTGCPKVPFMLPSGQRCDAGNSDSQQNGSLGGRGGSFPDTWPQLASLRTTTRTTSKSSDTVIKCVFNDTWVPSCVCSGNNRYSAPWPQPPSAQNVDCTADGVEPLWWVGGSVCREFPLLQAPGSLFWRIGWNRIESKNLWNGVEKWPCAKKDKKTKGGSYFQIRFLGALQPNDNWVLTFSFRSFFFFLVVSRPADRLRCRDIFLNFFKIIIMFC